ncbi:DUF4007 family protein [Flavobacterium chuncheonense]|uniref:DUF4007 family protein n=1 Tax=Flavobacterium chuncheonense TaxID=2026653 RepID=A0ABW5YJI8_9FLAO
MSNFKFSGHDTFHCRQQWLAKGVKLIESEGITVLNRPDIAISKLGVGKNMVQSIQHWLKSFGLLNEEHAVVDFAHQLFLGEKAYDPYLEDEGTLWLLQYKICNTQYASIYHLIFSEYFQDKVTLEFSESQIVNFLEKQIRDNNEREVSKNTLISDYKAFTKSYATPTKSLKTIEDDFNAPLLELDLISSLDSKNENGQTVYRINKVQRDSLPTAIFAYCLLDYLSDRNEIGYDELRRTIGSYFCLSNDGLDQQIESLCSSYPEFIYKDDAGVRQLQIKGTTTDYPSNLLASYYGV